MRPSAAVFFALTSAVFAAPIVLPPGTDISGPAGLPKVRLETNVEDKRAEDIVVTWKREADVEEPDYSGGVTWRREAGVEEPDLVGGAPTWRREADVEPELAGTPTWKRVVEPVENFGVTWKRVVEPAKDIVVTWKRDIDIKPAEDFGVTWKREAAVAEPDGVLPGGNTWKREEDGTDDTLPGHGGDWKRESENDSN